jgi:hypothetical protein
MNNTTPEDNNLFDDLAIHQSNQGSNATSRQCSGKGCTKIAKNLLTISYINKKGYFCDECTRDLVTKHLAIRIQEVSLTD